MPKTPAKPSYSLVADLHGMQGSAVRVRLAPLSFQWFEDYNLIQLV
tara:strand:+ start:212 stop:349 length:138 start_codon:yes stop_codon:yes gene_type:complete